MKCASAEVTPADTEEISSYGPTSPDSENIFLKEEIGRLKSKNKRLRKERTEALGKFKLCTKVVI